MERVAKIRQQPSENDINTDQDLFMNTPGSGRTRLRGKIVPQTFDNVEGRRKEQDRSQSIDPGNP